MITPSAAAIRLKGNPFARPDYFRTDVALGVTRTPSGHRVCTLPSEFFLGFREAAMYECGKAHRRVLKATGRRWGALFAHRLERELATHFGLPVRQLDRAVLDTCLTDAFNYHGFGRLAIDRASEFLTAELHDSLMPTLLPDSDRPVDLLATGLIGAVLGHFAGADLDALQTECPSRGAACSRFVLAPADRIDIVARWADALEWTPTHDAVLCRLRQPHAEEGA